jgi:hypothetical protein
MNIRPVTQQRAHNFQPGKRQSRDIEGYKTQEDACLALIESCIGEKFPQYVRPLYNYFAKHELRFDFLDAGLTIPREDGILFTLDIESEERRGVFSYQPVKVDVTWVELDKLISEGKV